MEKDRCRCIHAEMGERIILKRIENVSFVTRVFREKLKVIAFSRKHGPKLKW